MISANSDSDRLPCVVQVGFAGARKFAPTEGGQFEWTTAHDAYLFNELVEILTSLPTSLNLSSNHFLCGISQIAVGSDTQFTRACFALGIVQRIFYPQHRDAYFSATGSGGEPDFDEQQQTEALELLQSPHIIQERMVSDSPSRPERFEECNREILRVSDAVICLLQDGVPGKPGGTIHLLDLARRQRKPVLEVRVQVKKDSVGITKVWHHPTNFQPPVLPCDIGALQIPNQSELGKFSLPTVGEFCTVVKEHVSRSAQRYNKRFSNAAMVIILTHVLATLCATVVLGGHKSNSGHPPDLNRVWNWFAILLALELILLILGFLTHQWVHYFKPSKSWALARLLAEINRSVHSLGKMHLYVEYLFRLELPLEIRPLLRTLNVLHLRTTRPFRDAAWEPIRDQYIRARLDDSNPIRGQIAFYQDRYTQAHRMLRISYWLFMACSLLAIIATAVKLVILWDYPIIPEAWKSMSESFLGQLAVTLPVLAVGVLSWTAAKDYEARVHTFGDMLDFLHRQRELLLESGSLHEFRERVAENELKLLSETSQWYSRRSFAGVA